MAFWLTLLRLLRQRGVAVPALGVSLALAMTALVALPTTYLSTSTVVLTSSPVNQAAVAGDPSVPSAINPLLNFSEGLNTALAILIKVMNAPEVQTELAGDDYTATTVISDVGDNGSTSNGPFVYFTGTSARSADAARDLVVRAEQRARKELENRQRALGAPEDQFISMIVVTQPTVPVANRSTKLEGAALGFVLGFGSLLGFAYVREARRLRRFPDDATNQTAISPPPVPQPREPARMRPPGRRPVATERGAPIAVDGFERNGRGDDAKAAFAPAATSCGELLLLDDEEAPRQDEAGISVIALTPPPSAEATATTTGDETAVDHSEQVPDAQSADQPSTEQEGRDSTDAETDTDGPAPVDGEPRPSAEVGPSQGQRSLDDPEPVD